MLNVLGIILSNFLTHTHIFCNMLSKGFRLVCGLMHIWSQPHVTIAQLTPITHTWTVLLRRS